MTHLRKMAGPSTAAGSPSGQRFGAHMSAAGGLHLAFERGAKVGCECLQVFVRNQRQWKPPPQPTDEHVRAYREASAKHPLAPVVAHANYLLNLASPDAPLRKQSIATLVDEWTRCEAFGISALIFHPGAHKGEGVDAGIERIVAGIDEACRATTGFKARLLLEFTAGQGSAIGHTFEHLGRILASARRPERLGICLDTCHLFAAGHDLADDDSYARFAEELATHVGFAAIHCIHTNDSKTACGSRVDRHAHIGRGLIGRRGFRNLLTDPRLLHAPRILETPKGNDEKGRDLDRVNLQALRRLVR